MRVLSLMMIETGTYEDAFTHSYTTQLQHEQRDIELLKESTRNGTMVSPAGIAAVASNVLKQNIAPDGMCVIPNGQG